MSKENENGNAELNIGADDGATAGIENNGAQDNLDGSQGGAAADTWNPDEFELKYHDQVLKPKSKEELITLAQQGISYSDKMALLKQERERMNQELEPLRQYAALDQKFREDPAFQEHLTNAIQTYRMKTELGVNENEQVPPYVQQLMKKVSDIEQYKTNLEQKNADEKLNSELTALKSSYPDIQWDADDGNGTMTHRLLTHAYQNNIPSLKSAFRDMMFDAMNTNSKAEALKEAERKRLSDAKAGKIAGAGGTSTNVDLNSLVFSAKDSYNDLVQKAIASLNK